MSAFIIDDVTVEPDDEELLEDELDDFDTPVLPRGALCLPKPVVSVGELLAATVLGESDRALANPTGLSLLPVLPGLGFVVVFFINLLHSEQKKTDRGSFTSASLMFGWWHSWWYRAWHSWHSTS